MEQTKIKKETKRKIKVDFERAPLKERLKQKFFSMNFLTKSHNHSTSVLTPPQTACTLVTLCK